MSSLDAPSAAGMMEGLQLDDGADPSAKLGEAPFNIQFTEQERQILELYDRLEEIQLEISVLQAEESTPFGRIYSYSSFISRDLRIFRSARVSV
jgi:hypothetical protein